jgi:hypothetical protein
LCTYLGPPQLFFLSRFHKLLNKCIKPSNNHQNIDYPTLNTLQTPNLDIYRERVSG